MPNGISTSSQTGADAVCLATNGIAFVFRYYSTTTTSSTKRLTLREAQALAAAGIMLGTVYEDGPTNVDYFSDDRGVADGTRAWQYAQQIGQPNGSAIYFAVDYDALAADLTAIVSYFQGIQSGLDSASGGQSSYSIGVYGSGLVCHTIKQDQNLAKYSWTAESAKWQGTATYAGWDVMQASANSSLCSLAGPIAATSTQPHKPAQYEECQTIGDYGGFSIQQPQLVALSEDLTGKRKLNRKRQRHVRVG